MSAPCEDCRIYFEPDSDGNQKVICSQGFQGGCPLQTAEEIKQQDISAGHQYGSVPHSQSEYQSSDPRSGRTTGKTFRVR